MDREAWQATVHKVAKSWTRLSVAITFTFQKPTSPLECAHSSGAALFMDLVILPHVTGVYFPTDESFWGGTVPF